MEEKELANDEMKQKNAEIKAYEMQARRTDAVLEQNLKQNVESAMYQCGGCKSRKVTMHAMQTRSADEPMTEFYNCLNCGKSWKH